MPDAEGLAELRRICTFTLKKCTDPIIRKRAVYAMIFAEDDEHVERWFREAPDNQDYLESERRFDRYLDRKQWGLYYPQKQENMFDQFNRAMSYMGCYHESGDPDCDPTWIVQSRKRRMEILDVLFPGPDRILVGDWYRGMYIELAMALDDAGHREEAVAALTKAVDIQEEYIRYGESLGAARDAKVHFTDSMWNRLTRPAFPRAFPVRHLERFAEKPEYADNPDLPELLERVRGLH